MINTIELRCLKKSMAWARTLSVFISSGKIPSNDLNDPYKKTDHIMTDHIMARKKNRSFPV